ncbi:MAG: site-specific integrase [Pseudomonadota bacterium]|nr:site-specific integrase [Pseudomonadota bacterium]
MATIRKKGDMQWHVQIRRKGYPVQTKTFNTRALAEIWARDIESEMDKGLFVSRTEAEKTTLKTALERYLKEITPKKKGERQERNRIHGWLTHSLSSRFLASIRGSDMAVYRDELREAGKSESTIRLSMTIISHLFEIARKEWGMESLVNPCKNIRMPGGSKERIRRFEGEEEIRLMKELGLCKNKMIKPVCEFAIETGMRQSEILSLTWDNVDMKKRTAFIYDTKNGENRTVPLSSDAIQILKELPRSLHNEKIFYKVRESGLRQAFGHARVRAGIQDFHFHDLRHEATSRLFEKGLNIMEVASITGHKDLRMLKRYTHLKATDLAKKLG